jgi:D-sedoheptulose 7-phosphate isomerase
MMKILELLHEHLEVVRSLEALAPEIERLAGQMITSLQNGGKICWMGNGGSAADSQHLAAEFVGRFRRDRPGLASIALTTDSSVLTAVGNDYGYNAVFARQVETLCGPYDVVVGISTSGDSSNVIEAILSAQRIGSFTVAFTGGSGGRLARIADRSVIVPSHETARIQEAHILIGHILCELVEQDFITKATVLNGQTDQ